MQASEIFRSFRPLHNPLGFSGPDFVLLGLTLAFAVCLILRALLKPFWNRLACSKWLAYLLLFLLPIALRLAILPIAPVPVPAGADDFSYLLLGDTLAHLRLANPPLPSPESFETLFVLQQPAYSSIYPLGQGLLLALGQWLTGISWAGVLIASGALCALAFWALRASLPPRWALLAGLLALFQFGPLSQWVNSYWGGSLSACAGCLVFGSVERLRRQAFSETRKARRLGAIFGAGCGLEFLTRPFEFVLLIISVGLYFGMTWPAFRKMRVVCAPAMLTFLPAIVLVMAHNHAVTGFWSRFAYQESQRQYGVPATFTFRPNPIPKRALTPRQELDYRAQAAIHGPGTDSLPQYISRLLFRLSYLRFFLLPSLAVASLASLPILHRRLAAFVLLAVSIFLIGTNFYPYFYPQYIAAAVPLFLLVPLVGLRRLSTLRFRGVRSGKRAAFGLLLFAAAHFVFWYGLYFSNVTAFLPLTEWESTDFVNGGDPESRVAIDRQLRAERAKQLVFIRDQANYQFREWLGNRADIPNAHVVWARDLGPERNSEVLRLLPGRKIWYFDPSAKPPQLQSAEKASR